MSQFDRRQIITALAAAPVLAGPAAALIAGAARAQEGHAHGQPLITRPLRGVELPVIGIGTARRYADPADAAALDPLRDTIRRFSELGGTVIDTAPSYGRAEEVVGQLVEELGIRDKLFLATKVGVNTREEGAAQIEDAFRKLRTDRIDLIAVHNLRDVDNQLAILRDLRAEGRIGALGITTSSDEQYEAFEAVMRREQLDCIQIDYALDNRAAAERILPLAQEQGVAVMINLPFGRDRLFNATRDLPLNDLAQAIGATSWAQFFLKYVISHPSRPIAIPGMAQVRYVEDNLGAAHAPLPDAETRTRMERFIDAL